LRYKYYRRIYYVSAIFKRSIWYCAIRDEKITYVVRKARSI